MKLTPLMTGDEITVITTIPDCLFENIDILCRQYETVENKDLLTRINGLLCEYSYIAHLERLNFSFSAASRKPGTPYDLIVDGVYQDVKVKSSTTSVFGSMSEGEKIFADKIIASGGKYEILLFQLLNQDPLKIKFIAELDYKEQIFPHLEPSNYKGKYRYLYRNALL